jgi:RIO-like serine/threonine protein kinase
MNLFERITKTEDRMTAAGERVVQEVVEKYCKQIDKERIADVLETLFKETIDSRFRDQYVGFGMTETAADHLALFINSRLQYYIAQALGKHPRELSESELDALVERINKKQLAQPKLPAQ